jgi:NAD(P)-dependent dehydrogenase (short-subunit alcohol dehydrogenase family)
MATKYISKLQGKRVLVVGDTDGIGFCMAEESVEYGAIVVVASSQQAKVDKTIQRIKASYPDVSNRIRGMTWDLASADVEGQIKALHEFATDGGKNKLDYVVSTVGDSFRLVKLPEATPEAVLMLATVRYVGDMMLAKARLQYSGIILPPLAESTAPDPVTDGQS